MWKIIRHDEVTDQEPQSRIDEIQKDRVEALRTAIQSGTYHIPSDLVADCIIRETLGIFHGSRPDPRDWNLQSYKESPLERTKVPHTKLSGPSMNYRRTG